MGEKGDATSGAEQRGKLHCIHLHLDGYLSVRETERKYGVGSSLVSTWGKWYLEGGEDALKVKNGNPYATLYTSKLLSEVDRLWRIIAKQEVEIARLKKGIGWKELVQAGNTLLAKERLRSHRRTKNQVPGRFSVPTHGCKPFRLLQVAAAQRNSKPV